MIWRLPAAFVLVLATVWGAGALYFRSPLPRGATLVLIALFAGLLLSLAVQMVRRRSGPAHTVLALAALAALGGWYASLRPSDDLDWMPDVARRSLVEIDGNAILIRNLRHFEWQGENHGIERWNDARYALDQLQTLDLFLSYWSGPTIAHLVASFGFADGRQVAFSTEIRKQKGQDYDPLAGFFRSYTLAVIAAEESDVLKVRTNRRGEDMYRYRLDLKPETVRLLFMDYAALTQRLERAPAFYNSLLDNCSMVPFRMVRLRDPGAIPFDWHILTVGALPDYLHDKGFIDTRLPKAEVRTQARITQKALDAEQAADFSAAIRVP